MTLENTLKQFALTFGRNGFDIGSIEIDPNPIEIDEPQLEGELKEFYSLSKFNELIIGGAFFLEICSLEELSEAQIGWRFNINPKNGNITEDTKYWNKNWVVFGDRNGDAIFCKQDIEKNPVYGSIQKARNLLLAPSVNTFFQILNECMRMEQDDFQFDTQTDDFVRKADFIDAVQNIVSKYNDQPRDFIDFFFG